MNSLQPELDVTSFVQLLVRGIGRAKDEVSDKLEIGLTNYLDGQIEKYYLINNFLFKEKKVRYDKAYFPVRFKYQELETTFENLDDVLDEYNFISIIGIAGSGKSSLARKIFMDLIFSKNRIPILLELRGYNDFNGEFEDYIFKKLLKTRVRSDINILKRALSAGIFVFIFDGYDEVFSSKQARVKQQMMDFIDMFKDNKYIITSRPGAGIDLFTRFYKFDVQNLNIEEIYSFINKFEENEERKLRVKEVLSNDKYSDYLEYVKNPLLLSMFLLTFSNFPELPSAKSEFYHNVFDTLYSKHDGLLKGSYKRERASGLQRDDFEAVLRVFSYITFFREEYSFTDRRIRTRLREIKKFPNLKNYSTENIIKDLTLSISIIIKDGYEYTFPHRSLQEYFAASFVHDDMDGEMKEEFYSSLLVAKMKNNTYIGSENFLGLCSEVDNFSFNQYYLFAGLKRYLRQLNACKESKSTYEAISLFGKIKFPAYDIIDNYAELLVENNTLLYMIELIYKNEEIPYKFKFKIGAPASRIINSINSDQYYKDNAQFKDEVLIKKLKGVHFFKEFWGFIDNLEKKLNSKSMELETKKRHLLDLSKLPNL